MSSLTSTSTSRRKGIIAFIILAVVFAAVGVFIRELGHYFTILQQSYLRLTVSLLAGLAVFRRQLDFSKLRKIRWTEWIVLLLRAGFLYLLGLTFLSKALSLTYFSNVSFIDALPTTAILGFIVLREKITWQKVGCIGLGCAGVVFVGVRDYSHLFVWGKGEVLTIFAAFFFGASYILRKFQTDTLNNQEMSVLIIAIGTIMLFVTSTVFFNERAPQHILNPMVASLIIGGGLLGIASMYLTNYGFEKIDAALGSNLMMLETPFTVVLGYLCFSEIPSFQALVGGGMIVLSTYLMNKVDH